MEKNEENGGFSYTEQDLADAFDQERTEYEEPFEVVRKLEITRTKAKTCTTSGLLSSSGNLPEIY